MWQDIRVALRGFRTSPAFTVTALATLALAIGANTTTFNLLNALVLRDAPVRDPRTLVQVSSLNSQNGFEGGLTYALYEDFKRRQSVFSSVLGWRASGVYNIDADGQSLRGMIAIASGDYFNELGARPAAGRLLTTDDLNEPSDRPAMVAVLGHTLWQRAFASDPGIIGRTIAIEAARFTIVGVAPPNFIGLGMFVEADVTVPLTALPLFDEFISAPVGASPSTFVRVTGRLKPGVTLEQARAAVELLWPDLKADNVPPSLQGARRDAFLATGLLVRSAAKGNEAGPGMRARFTRPLYALLAIALVVLLIACLNLASLMVARGVAASHDISVRLALGAARLRVMRAVLVEGLLLAVGGAAAGLLFAIWTSDALARLILQDYTVRATLDVTPDLRVLTFTSAVALGAGVLSSLLAALRAGRQDTAAWLRENTRTTTARRHAGRWLVAGQVGLSLALLSNAGLLIRSLQEVRAVSSGMDTRDVVVAYPAARPGGYAGVDNDSYYRNLVGRLEQIPGVQRASIANFKPAGGGVGGGERVAPVGAVGDGLRATFMSISPSMFDVLRMPVREGRDFMWSDHAQARRVAVISETLARALFPGQPALGQRVRIGIQPRRQDVEIIGVVGDAHIYDLKDPNLAGVYVPSLQEPDLVDGKCLIIRGSGASLQAIQAALAPFGIETVSRSETLDYIVDRVLLQDRLTAMFALFFGAVALLMAAVGTYGLMSFAVNQRLREIAIRVALGADRAAVIKNVAGDGIQVTVAGLVAGILLALVSVTMVESLIFGVTPYDALTLVAATTLLAGIALAACLMPALRASRTDPTTLLRMT